MIGELDVVATRQDVDAFEISQVLLGANATAVSDIVLCQGDDTVRILARSIGGPMAVRVMQAVAIPNTGLPVFIETGSLASSIDPLTGENVIAFDSVVFGVFMRIELVNGAVPQTAFEISAYLLPGD